MRAPAARDFGGHKGGHFEEATTIQVIDMGRQADATGATVFWRHHVENVRVGRGLAMNYDANYCRHDRYFETLRLERNCRKAVLNCRRKEESVRRCSAVER